MTVEEHTSRVFYIRGETSIQYAFSTRCKPPIKVEKGRCLYLIRMELASPQHPEISENKYGLNVISTWTHIYFQKGLGGGKRGPSDKPKTFEQLIEGEDFPRERTDKNLQESTVEGLAKRLVDIMQWSKFNLNAKILSEFDGYWQGIGNSFDKIKTYDPVIMQACRELRPHL